MAIGQLETECFFLQEALTNDGIQQPVTTLHCKLVEHRAVLIHDLYNLLATKPIGLVDCFEQGQDTCLCLLSEAPFCPLEGMLGEAVQTCF